MRFSTLLREEARMRKPQLPARPNLIVATCCLSVLLCLQSNMTSRLQSQGYSGCLIPTRSRLQAS